MPIAEYLKIDDEIPTFETDLVYPFRTGDGKVYDGFCLRTGTVIKLYDFQIGKRFRTFRGAREAFNENLVDTILPFRLLDFRQKPDPKRGGDRALGIDPRPFYGMEYLLLRAHAAEGIGGDPDENQEDEEKDVDEEMAAASDGKLTVDVIDDPELGRIEISAIPLKRGKPKWLQPSNSNRRIFHTVNGQVQFKQTRGFLTSCGLPALKDRVVVFVDASDLTFGAHNDVWKGDREDIRETIVGERYKALVKEAIEKSVVLKDPQEKVAKEELTQAANKQRNELFQQLVNKDPQVAALLRGNDPTIIFVSAEETDEKESYDGKYSPTIFDLEKKAKELGVSVPVNKARPVVGLTDVENGYLLRADNTGQVYFSDETVREMFTIRQSLHDGRLVLFFTPVEEKVASGTVFTFEVGLFDPGMPAPVTDKLTIRVVDPAEENEKKKREGKKKKSKETKKPTLSLPPYVLLTKDGRAVGDHPVQKWPEGLNDFDGGLIQDLGDESVLYKINYDNSYHLKYRHSASGETAKDAITEKYVAGMRLMLLGFEHAFREGSQAEKGNGETDWLTENGDEIRRLAARGAASTVLALAEHLPKIAAVPEDEPE